AQCSFHLNGTSGTFHSPNYPQNYPPLADCNWTINVAENYFVRLDFQDFSIEGPEPCEFDKLTVRNGPDCISPIIKILCGDAIPQVIFSSGPSLYVQFITSTFVQAKGFQASFTQVERLSDTTSSVAPVCEQTITDEKGIFSTPNYPNPYPRNIECVWKIVTQADKRIMLTFLDFNLYSDCYMAHMDVYDGFSCSARILRHCGLTVPKEIRSSGSQLMVVFRSSGENSLRGFQASYSVGTFYPLPPRCHSSCLYRTVKFSDTPRGKISIRLEVFLSTI
ncbi:hypothetical protein FBUS_07344, partial [Fasciolopsis buskii]